MSRDQGLDSGLSGKYTAPMLGRLFDHLSRHPSGWVARAVAVFAVAVPAGILGRSSTNVVWVGDTLPVVPTVVQLFRHGDRDLSGYLAPPREGRWEVFPRADSDPHCVRPGPGGVGRYSGYPAGMEVFVWPRVLWAAALGLPVERDDCQFTIERETAATVGGIVVGLFFLAALHIGRPGAAFVTAGLLATGSVVVTTLTQLMWQQTGVAFWMLVVVLVELQSAGRPGWVGAGVQALACSLMLACRPSAVTFLIPFGLWVVARDRKRGLTVPVAAVVGFLPWAGMYHAVYSTPFGPSMAQLGEPWTAAGHVGGVLFSPARGLFVYQPWMWVGFLLLFRRVRTDPARRPLPPGWYPFTLAVIASHVVLVGSWGCWWGGYCWGSRLAAEVVPVAGLLVVRPVGWLLRRWWGWAALAGVTAAGFAVHAPYVFGDGGRWNIEREIDAHPEHLWDWRAPPFLFRERE
ncbi:MAG: hypothetical protein JWO38_6345 [Gemmataceae bacterium]|nr:hypothetical protein [Gemmataceae bacterium]